MARENNLDANEIVFDPNQDPEEKRRIRDGYRHKLKDMEEYGRDLKNLDVDVLLEGVKNADISFDGVYAPEEAVLDSRLLTTMSSLGAAKAKALRHDGGGFDTDEFIARMVHFLGGDRVDLQDEDEENGDVVDVELNWSKLGVQALGFSRRVPGLDFMFGPLNLEMKKRTVRKQAKAEKVRDDEKSRPKELTREELKTTDKSDVDLVRELGKIIEAAPDPIGVFELCINPDSFGQSVENFFYLSFLIRDSKVALDLNDEGEMIVYACEAPGAEELADGMAKAQCVWQIDEQLWKTAIEAYNITQSMVPTRAVPDEHTYSFYGR